MVTTALIAYWYQAKNECVSVGGWIILFAYYSSMIFNRSVLSLEILFYDRNQVHHKIAWGLGEGQRNLPY